MYGKIQYIGAFSLKLPRIKISLDDSFIEYISYFLKEIEKNNSPSQNSGVNSAEMHYITINKMEILPFEIILSNRITEVFYLPIDNAEFRIEHYIKSYHQVEISKVVEDVLNMLKSLDWHKIGKVVTHSSLFGNVSSALNEVKDSISQMKLFVPEIIISVPTVILKNAFNMSMTIGKNIISLAIPNGPAKHYETLLQQNLKEFKQDILLYQWVNDYIYF